MNWVRRTSPPEQGHKCEPPMRERVFLLPVSLTDGDKTIEHRDSVPDGAWRDLWRCTCGELWRVGNDCDYCDPYPLQGRCRGGGIYHATGYQWRPATWWQRVRNRGQGWDRVGTYEDIAESARWDAAKED